MSSDNNSDEPKTRLKVYTRTGDKGTSALFSGERRPKEDSVFDALGTTDELSCHIGLAREYARQQGMPDSFLEHLVKIQCMLQDAGSNVATPRDAKNRFRVEKTQFDADGHATEQLELWIDEMDQALPPLTQFILPSGGLAAAQLHVARATCRRAERIVVPLTRDQSADASVARYLNRLSDFLFVAARYAARQADNEETIYQRVQ